MNLGWAELLISITLVSVGVWGLIDALMRPASRWQAIGSSRGVGLVFQLLFPGIGALASLMAVRPKFEAIDAAEEKDPGSSTACGPPSGETEP